MRMQKTTKRQKEARPRAPLYSCANCDYTSNRQFNLRTHEYSCSDLQLRYQCLVCSIDFSHLSTLKRHHLGHKKTKITNLRVLAIDAADGKWSSNLSYSNHTNDQ